jgi:hypothetical protein
MLPKNTFLPTYDDWNPHPKEMRSWENQIKNLYRTNGKLEPQSSQRSRRKALKLGVLPGTARQGRCSALRGKKG